MNKKDIYCLGEVLVYYGFVFCPQVLSLGWRYGKKEALCIFSSVLIFTVFLHSAF